MAIMASGRYYGTNVIGIQVGTEIESPYSFIIKGFNNDSDYIIEAEAYAEISCRVICEKVD